MVSRVKSVMFLLKLISIKGKFWKFGSAPRYQISELRIDTSIHYGLNQCYDKYIQKDARHVVSQHGT